MLETDEEDVNGAEPNVIFHKENASEMTNDMWDDSALIKAYDKAVSEAHNQFTELNSPRVDPKKSKKKKGKNRNRSKVKQWRVGDRCRAIFSEDNQIYEAEITQLIGNDKCVVLYTDYGNEEQQLLMDLVQPRELPERHKHRVQSSTPSTAYSEVSTSISNSLHSGSKNPAASLNQMGSRFPDPLNSQTFMPCPPQANGPTFIPPPPPSLPDMGSCTDEEAMHSMLISWYMSGYHTGYFQGLKQARHEGKNAGS